MRVAVLGDVHANLPALEAVLAHAWRQGASKILNVGDFVGYGPHPQQVVDRLREVQALSVIGNYDRKVLKVPQKRQKWKKTKRKEKLLAFEWAYEHLSDEARAYLASLPEQRVVDLAGRRLTMVHGSPESISEHLLPDTPQARLEALAAQAGPDIVVCGHSHQAFVRQARDVLFINTGSVGRSDDGDSRACYAILDLGNDRAMVQHFRVDYDAQSVAADIRRAGLPEAFAQMILQGRGLDDIAPASQPPEREAPPEPDEALRPVLQLADSCGYERRHCLHVADLALSLFDQLADLHGLDAHDRYCLEAGAILHDIGWMAGQSRHHLTAQRIILSSPLLPMSDRDRRIVAAIARYHRKAIATDDAPLLRPLDAPDRRRARILAGIIRVADGLDRSHRSVVRQVECRYDSQQITIECLASHPCERERQRALEKAALMEETLGRRLIVQWQLA